MSSKKESKLNGNSVIDDSPDSEKTDWQSKMLKRLIESAIPEPIKVACTISPPGKPEYLGEEYHGRISKEEEKRLLEGKSGRYIVRESFSTTGLHEYTLAFNHDGEIRHVKLIYNPLSNTFKTDSSEKDFKSVLELMTDVLGLFQDIKRSQSNGNFSKKEKYSKPHLFKSHNYKHPKWCDECGQFLWGLFNQGYKCEDCGINVHKNCKDLAPLPCSKVIMGPKISFSKEGTRFSKKRGSKSDQGNTGSESPSPSYAIIKQVSQFEAQCAYFRQCSKFLSAFNIRDTYVDMKNTLTRCFCDQCINMTEQGAMVTCNSLKQWTRFQFSQQQDTLKRKIKDWEVVYFAIKPHIIIDMLKKCFVPLESEQDFDLVVAPSLAYTVQDMKNENWSYKFTDPSTAKELFAQTVLECYVRPGSYKIIVLPNTDNVHECGAPLVPENWKIKDKKDIYPKSILVKIFDK